MGIYKRTLATALVACLLSTALLSGCTSPSPKSASSTQPSEVSPSSATSTTSSADKSATAAGGTGGIVLPVSPTLVEYTFMAVEDPKVPFIDSFVVLPELEKRTNVRLNLIKVPTANYADKLSVTLASGNIPDYIANVNTSIANQYGQKGLFLNVWDYIDQMPNMKRCFDTITGFEDYKFSDTELYNLLVQCSPDSDPQGFGYYKEIPMVRMDVLGKLNLKTPTTFDELYDMLAAVKKAYPASYPWGSAGDANNITGGLQPLISQMLVAWSGDVFSWENNYTVYDQAQKSWSFALDRPGFKDLIEYIAKAYKDGLLDPEFLVMQGSQWEERMLNDKSFFSYAYWNQSDNLNVKAVAAGKKDFKLMGFAPPVKNGKSSVIVRPVCSNTNAVSAKVKNPEILMKALDYLLYSKDGTMLNNAGIQDVNWVWDQTDKVYKLIDPANPNPDNETHKQKFGVRYGYFTGLRPDHFDIHNFVFNAENNVFYQQGLIYKGKGINPAPVKIYRNSDDASSMKQIGVPLRDYIEQHLSKIITGTENISTWDSLIKSCKDMGVDNMLKILNK